MKHFDPNPPAIIRPAESLAELASEINAAHAAGEEATQRGLEHYRKAGEALIRARGGCERGKWLTWLKANVRVRRSRVYQYIELAKLPVTGNLEDDWRRISGNADQADEDAGDPPPPAPEPPPPDVRAEPAAPPAPAPPPPPSTSARNGRAAPEPTPEPEPEAAAEDEPEDAAAEDETDADEEPPAPKSEEEEIRDSQADARRRWLKKLSEVVEFVERLVAPHTDEELAWFTEPDSPGLFDHGITAERVEVVIVNLQRVKQRVLRGEDAPDRKRSPANRSRPA